MGLSMGRVFDVTTAQRTAGAALSQAPSSPAGCAAAAPGGGEVRDLRDLSVSRSVVHTVPGDRDLARTLAAGGSVTGQEAAGLTGASYRQVDYWIRLGVACRHLRDVGSGVRREFVARDLEVLVALAQLAALGCRDEPMRRAAEAVEAAPVDAAGERLVVFLDGSAYRMPVGSPISAEGPLWQVPLRSFAGARP